MRLAIAVAVFGLMVGAPVFAPTSLMETAVAQDAAVDALAAELVAAAGDPTAIAAIVAREQAAGNINGLALALISAARTVVVNDTAAGAQLAIQAVRVAEGADDDTQDDVGEGASDVSTTAMNAGDSSSATDVETEVAMASDMETQMAYVNAGGSAGNNLGQNNNNDNDDNQQQQGGGNDSLPSGDQQDTTPTTPTTPTPPTPPGPPPRPPVTNVVIPVPVEPNPSQSGSPT